MALSDILSAITHETDDRIAFDQERHRQHLKDLQARSEAEIRETRATIDAETDATMARLKTRTEGRAEMRARHVLLEKKRELLDEVYEKLTAALAELPEAEVKRFLERCLKSLPSKGTVHPAATHEKVLRSLLKDGLAVGKPVDASGGFVFVSDTEVRNYTFEFLISQFLRPSTEVEVAHRLFS